MISRKLFPLNFAFDSSNWAVRNRVFLKLTRDWTFKIAREETSIKELSENKSETELHEPKYHIEGVVLLNL